MSVAEQRAREVAEAVPGSCLVALGGSHAYGMEHAGSDLDVLGVYAVGIREALSLRPPAKTKQVAGGDATVYELGHFCKLAAAANPTVLEALWAPTLWSTEPGHLLAGRRSLFLSRRARDTYGGYAIAQLRKAEAGVGGSRGVAVYKREKFLAHTLRLAQAGLHVVETGDLRVRVPDPEWIRSRAAAGLTAVQAEVEQILSAMDAALPGSPLPVEPGWAAIDDLIYDVRTAVA